MRRILKFLMSRSFFFSVMILLQLALFIALMVTFSRVGGVAYLLITLTVVVVMMAVLEKTNTNPAYRIMWLLIVVTMPMSGALFYLLWGSHGIKPKKAEDFLRIEHRANKIMQQDEAAQRAFCTQYSEYRPHMEYLARNAAAPLYDGTKVEYYPFGQDFFPRFLEKLKAARHYIFMEYFIVQDGEMWGRTLEVLRQKVKEGVDVRVLYDGFGCLFTLPSDYAETLRAQGIQFMARFCTVKINTSAAACIIQRHRIGPAAVALHCQHAVASFFQQGPCLFRRQELPASSHGAKLHFSFSSFSAHGTAARPPRFFSTVFPIIAHRGGAAQIKSCTAGGPGRGLS